MAWNLHGNNPTAAIKFNFTSESRLLRPQYFVYELLHSHVGSTITPAQVISPVCRTPRVGNVGPLEDIPCLQVLATFSPPDRLHLWVLNRSLDQKITTKITFQDFHPQPTVRLRSLHGPSPAAHNDVNPCQIMIQTKELPYICPILQYTFPAHSLTLMEFQNQECMH